MPIHLCIIYGCFCTTMTEVIHVECRVILQSGLLKKTPALDKYSKGLELLYLYRNLSSADGLANGLFAMK